MRYPWFKSVPPLILFLFSIDYACYWWTKSDGCSNIACMCSSSSSSSTSGSGSGSGVVVVVVVVVVESISSISIQNIASTIFGLYFTYLLNKYLNNIVN